MGTKLFILKLKIKIFWYLYKDFNNKVSRWISCTPACTDLCKFINEKDNKCILYNSGFNNTKLCLNLFKESINDI